MLFILMELLPKHNCEEIWRRKKKKKKKKTWIGSVTLPSASGCFWWTETSSSVSDWFLSICVPQLCVSCLLRADTHLAQAPPTSFLCELSSTKGCPSAHCHGSSISIRLEPPWHVLALRLLFRCIVQQLLLIGGLLCKATSLFGLVCHSVWDRSSVCCFYWAVMSFFFFTCQILWKDHICHQTVSTCEQCAVSRLPKSFGFLFRLYAIKYQHVVSLNVFIIIMLKVCNFVPCHSRPGLKFSEAQHRLHLS